MLVETEIAEALREALREGWVEERDTAVVFYDYDQLDRRIAEIKAAFPKKTLHTAAVKACPLREVLRAVVGEGFGLEVASMPELEHALELGCRPDRIVFDSPVKTRDELAFALERGIHINADNLEEVQRIEALLNQQSDFMARKGRIGLRINPQVGLGTIEATSVAGLASKFGEPIAHADAIKAAFERCPWLDGLHLHCGSQAIPLALLKDGVIRVWQLAQELAACRGTAELGFFDIGGGLPVRYLDEQESYDLSDYLQALQQELPLLSGQGLLITEFGRYLFANAGWAATRVEYLKNSGPITYAITHIGADLLLRQCYQPHSWHHRWSAFDPTGQLKEGERHRYDIAGPLCFGGDVPARGIDLPRLEPGDWIAARDCGAYTYSMWSRYNSRQAPLVLGYAANGKTRIWQRIKSRESVSETLAFWR